MNRGAAAAHTPRWGMVVDLNRCVGCQTCTIACKHANDTPPGVQWRRVLDVEVGSFPSVERLFLVTGCQHCAEPPCVPVCPTGATRQREDGLVTMNYDVCIGCAYCAVSCPYQARTIVHDERWYYGVETRQEKEVAHAERRGVAQKCTFCVERVDAAPALGLTPGVDPDVTPACSAACIAQAIHFGDFADPASNVSRLAAGNPVMQLNAELGTDPQIKYLYTTPAVPGREPSNEDEERLADPANPLVGARQTLWDWRAAMNWCFGGVSSGFAVLAALGAAAGAVDPARLPGALAGAAALMAIGLFFVFLKIGRKLRFWRAISRPQTSWMTRELYAVGVFYPAVAANLVAPRAGLEALAAAAAAAFLLCQAQILYRARGIPAWRAPLIPWMIFATGLLEGFGLVALAAFAWRGFAPAPAPFLPVAGLVLVLVNAGLWIAYRRTARARGIPPLARGVIGRAGVPLHLLGHAVPAILVAASFAAPDAAPALLGLAGIAAIAGGAFWKFAVIVRAGYQQGFALAKLPQRGSGERAAPARLTGLTAAPR